ncbi:MAG: GNAT family N-acetyltransferase [Acidimicrobiales bacterium]
MPESTINPLAVAGPDLGARQLHDLLKLRVDIFVVEQECPYHEIDGRDLLDSTEHVWLADELGPRAALRVLADPEGRRIGRVVTRADQRGQGLAAQLMEWTHHHIGSVVTVLDGQSHLRAFYERLGYEVSGPEFIEDGIPHLPMRRTPNDADHRPRTMDER